MDMTPPKVLSRPQVVSIESFLTDVIRYSADVTQEHELYTLEDGLDLWLAVQCSARNPTQETCRI